MRSPKVVAMTSSLQKLVDMNLAAAKTPKAKNAVLEYFDDGVTFFKNTFKKVPDDLNRAYTLHQFVDRENAKNFKTRPDEYAQISCKAGCAACCHTTVMINEEEAKLLIGHAKDIGLELDWVRIEKLASIAKRGNEKAFFRLPKEESRCEFLGSDNRCKVYEHRPASCRKYFVRSHPDRCADRVDNNVEILADIQVELAVSGMMDIDHKRIGSMYEMLMKARSSDG